VARIAGPQLAGLFKDMVHGVDQPIDWMAPFVIAGVARFVGALVMALTAPPELTLAVGQGTRAGPQVA